MQIDQVSGEGGVKVREVPVPRAAPVMVILHAPDQSLQVGEDERSLPLRVVGVRAHLLEIVSPLIVPSRLRLIAVWRGVIRVASHLLAHHVALVQGDQTHERLKALHVQLPLVGQVPSQLRQHLRVDAHHHVERPVGHVEGRQPRKKVVTHQHAQKHEVVHRPLLLPHKAERAGQHRRPHRAGQALAEQLQLQEDKVLVVARGGGGGGGGVGERAQLEQGCRHPAAAPPAPGSPGSPVGAAPPAAGCEPSPLELLPLAQQAEVGFVCDHAEHDQIGVQPVHAMARGVRRGGLGAGLADEVHDLVLPLARHVRAREDHRRPVLPLRVGLHLRLNPALVPLAQPV
mmetsp:Transcript_16819/g.54779  ORF Transcript_16819/g.54779 Transcript_16819/m.54779 type:complete len:343 (-) Transcript_16819:709-1737(-)